MTQLIKMDELDSFTKTDGKWKTKTAGLSATVG